MTPGTAAARLCELSDDARAAVLLDGRGELVGFADGDEERAGRLAELAGELVEAADSAGGGEPPEQVEAQVDGGAVYLLRRSGWTLAVVARRSALSSLMFYDARAVLSELEGAG